MFRSRRHAEAVEALTQTTLCELLERREKEITKWGRDFDKQVEATEKALDLADKKDEEIEELKATNERLRKEGAANAALTAQRALLISEAHALLRKIPG